MKRLLYLLTLLTLLVGCAGPAPISANLEPVVTREAVIDTSAPSGDVLMKAPEENPKRGGILKTAWGANPTHFDIHQGGGCAGCTMMYDGLVMWNLLDGYRTIIPALATTWSVSDDQAVYTFNLRQGVKFHDGTPFSADDVVATFNRIINPPENVAIAGIKEELAMVKEVTAPDANTVVFTLKNPTPYFLEIMAGDNSIVYSKAELEKNNYDLKAVTVPTGTGPFKFKEFINGNNEGAWIPPALGTKVQRARIWVRRVPLASTRTWWRSTIVTNPLMTRVSAVPSILQWIARL